MAEVGEHTDGALRLSQVCGKIPDAQALIERCERIRARGDERFGGGSCRNVTRDDRDVGERRFHLFDGFEDACAVSVSGVKN